MPTTASGIRYTIPAASTEPETPEQERARTEAYRRIPGVPYDEYGRPVSRNWSSVNEFVSYVDSLGPNASEGARRQVAAIKANPEGYEIRNGQPVERPGWLERNKAWALPLAVLGGAGASALIGGGGPAAASAASASGSAGGTLGAATPIAGLHTAVPGAVAPAISVAPSMAGTLGAATPIAGAHAAVPGALTAGGSGAGLLANEAIDAATGATPLGGIRPGDGRDLASGLGDFFTNPRYLAGLGGIIASLVASRNSGGNSQATDQAMADASRLNKITEARMRRVDPMHEAVTQLAFGRLPVSSRNGINLTRVPLPPQEG